MKNFLYPCTLQLNRQPYRAAKVYFRSIVDKKCKETGRNMKENKEI